MTSEEIAAKETDWMDTPLFHDVMRAVYGETDACQRRVKAALKEHARAVLAQAAEIGRLRTAMQKAWDCWDCKTPGEWPYPRVVAMWEEFRAALAPAVSGTSPV